MNLNNEQKNAHVRQRILSALLLMLENTEIDEISVSELVRQAEVGRASFYRNYTDAKDVLRQEADRLMTEWEKQFEGGSETSFNAVLSSLLDFYRSHRTFYQALYKADLSDIIMYTIVDSFPIGDDKPNEEAYRQSSLAFMIYGWIHEWILRGMQEPGPELIRMIEQSQKNRH